MNVVFMGTPKFAVPTLEALAQAGHEISGVITQPDAMRDRGKKLQPTPVKEKAVELGIPVYQPAKIKNNEEFLATLKELAPDVIVVAAYGKILPAEVLIIPPLGCVNVHASLLPKYRGAGPIQRAILEGEEKTGITIMYMAEGLDTGDMLSKAETSIEKKTAEELTEELALMGGKLLVETLPLLESGEIQGEVQDDSLATYAPMISKKDGQIDFEKSAVEIERQVRAMIPWPGAYTYYKGELFKIWEASTMDETGNNAPGTVTAASGDGIVISTKEGSLVAKTVQIPGKKRVSAADYLKGNSIELLRVLG